MGVWDSRSSHCSIKQCWQNNVRICMKSKIAFLERFLKGRYLLQEFAFLPTQKNVGKIFADDFFLCGHISWLKLCHLFICLHC